MKLFNRMKPIFSLLSVMLLLLFVLTMLVPLHEAKAQVFAPCSTTGCKMYGNILFNGAAPTATGTGTPTVTTGSTNQTGSVTAGSSATSVVLTFANGSFTQNPASAVPFCTVESETQLAAFSYVVTGTTITVTQTATSGNVIVWHCFPSV